MEYTYYRTEDKNREAVDFNIMDGEQYVTTCVVDVDLLICGVKKFPCGNGNDETLTPQQRLEILELVRRERKGITSRERVKSLKGWRESGLNFEEYILPGNEVMQGIVDEIVNGIPPVSLRKDCTQAGEPFSSEPTGNGGVMDTYITFRRIEEFLWRGERIWIFDGYCFRGENENRYRGKSQLERAIDKVKAEMEKFRWRVYTYSQKIGTTECSKFCYLKEAEEAASKYIREGERNHDAAIIYDEQEQRLKKMYGCFPVRLLPDF